MLPITSPFSEYSFLGKYLIGKINAGWEKVKPIKMKKM
jgi:hypothetical protein